MGSKMGPNYACLFVGYVEEKLDSKPVPRFCNSTAQEIHQRGHGSRMLYFRGTGRYIHFVSN